MRFWRLIALAFVLLAGQAWAQSTTTPPPSGGCVRGTEPACGPPPPALQPDWYAQKKCPASVDCMPG